MWNLPKGEAFLPKVSTKELQRLYQKEQKAKPKLRLLCAIKRKKGGSIDEISDSLNMKRRTVHETIRRFVERGIEGKDSIKQSGRPPKLNIKQRQKLIEILDNGPPHNKTGLWTTKEVREIIRKKFGVKYAHQHVWDMLKAAGFSIQKPRPRNHRAPSKSEMAHFKKKLRCWRGISGKKVS